MDENENDCPVCGGVLVPLGTLGIRDYFRCRDCGMDCSHETGTVYLPNVEEDGLPEF